MDLRSLRYFVAVVDAGGITRAAEALFVSQPSLSQTIRQLESELDVTLLDRSGRRAVPTAEGRRLHALAKQALAEAARAAERVARVADLEVGRLVVATSATLSVDPLTRLVVALREAHPALEVQVRDGRTPAGVLDLLRAGDAELGLVDTVVDEPGWETLALASEEVVLATAPDYRRPVPDPVPREAVARLDVGVVDADVRSAAPAASVLRDLVGAAQVHCAHRPMLWDLVRRGTVTTFVGRRTAAAVLPWARLHPLEPPVWREVGLVWREATLSPAGAALVRIAEGLDEGAGDGGQRAGVVEHPDRLGE